MGLIENIRKNMKDNMKRMKEVEKLRERMPLYEACYTATRAQMRRQADYGSGKGARYPSLSDEDMSALKRLDTIEYVEKLDSMAHMKSSVDAAYDAAIKAKQEGLSTGDAYLDVGIAVHDAWCIEHRHQFESPKKDAEAYQYLSTESLGWDEFKKDMKYASVALQAFGYPEFTNVEDLVKSHYDAMRAEYMKLDPEAKESFEGNRWIDLTWKAADDAVKEGLVSDRDDSVYTAHAVSSYEDLKKPSGCWVYDGEMPTDSEFIVGHPFYFTDFHDITFAAPSPMLKEVIAQSEARFEKPQPQRRLIELDDKAADEEFGLGGS